MNIMFNVLRIALSNRNIMQAPYPMLDFPVAILKK